MKQIRKLKNECAAPKKLKCLVFSLSSQCISCENAITVTSLFSFFSRETTEFRRKVFKQSFFHTTSLFTQPLTWDGRFPSRRSLCLPRTKNIYVSFGFFSELQIGKILSSPECRSVFSQISTIKETFFEPKGATARLLSKTFSIIWGIWGLSRPQVSALIIFGTL